MATGEAPVALEIIAAISRRAARQRVVLSLTTLSPRGAAH
jgi:hypothetical protein